MRRPSADPTGSEAGDPSGSQDTSTTGDPPGGQAPHRNLPIDPDVPEQPRPKARRRAVGVFRDRWDILLVIAAGGALGSLARWAMSMAIPHATGAPGWAATWVENVTGGLLLGGLMVLILDVWPPRRYLRPFVGVGILGGYTTFSTYMLDAWTLLAAGRAPTALGYLFGTLISGLVAVWFGILAARSAVGLLERRRRRRRRHERRAANPTDDRGDPNQAADDLDLDPDARSTR